MKKLTIILILSICLFTTTFLQGKRIFEQGTSFSLKITEADLQPERFGSFLEYLTRNKVQELYLPSITTDDQLDAILGQVGEELGKLDLDWCFKLYDYSPIARCRNLQALRLSTENITDTKFAELLSSQIGGSLRFLNLYRCLSLSDFSPIANCINLQELHLGEAKIIDDQLAFILDRIGNNLRRLKLGFCKNLSDFSPIANCINLEELYLSGNFITTDQLTVILSQIKNLRRLELSSCTNLKDFFPIAMSENLQELVFRSVPITAAQLTSLLHQIGGRLRKLSITSCKQLDDFSSIGNCINLQELDLNFPAIMPPVQLDVLLRQIGENLKSLQLHSYCDLPLAIDFFAPITRCKNLQELDLGGNFITATQLNKILKKIGKNLRVLALGSLNPLALIKKRTCFYADISSDITRCKNLQELVLLSNPAIYDHVVAKILGKIGQNLRVLYLSNCKNVSSEMFEFIATNYSHILVK